MKTISTLFMLLALCCSGLNAQCVDGVCFPAVRTVVQRSANVVQRVLPQSVVEHKVETFNFCPANTPCGNPNCACVNSNCGSTFAFVAAPVVTPMFVVPQRVLTSAQSSVRWHLIYEHGQPAWQVDAMSPAQQEALHNQLHANEQRAMRLFYRPLKSFGQIPVVHRLRNGLFRFR